MKSHWIAAASLLLWHCTTSRQGAVPAAPSQGAGETRVFGTLRALMHEGKTGPQVALASVVPGPHAYAVGALSELRGEVTIVDDTVWLAYPNDDGTARAAPTQTTNEQAALLVAADVAAWRRIPITGDIRPEQLDVEVERLAKANHVDVSRPVPLRIEGDLIDVRWHVVDGRKLGGAKTHEDHAAAAARGSTARAKGMLVGFYSNAHQGIFTHMSRKTHLHVVLPNEGVAGHVDGVKVGAGSTLLVPE